MAEVKLTSEEKVSFSFAPATPKGTPGLIDGTVNATVEEGDAAVAMNPDGMSGFILSGSTAGTSKIRFSADADLSSTEVRTIEEVVDVIVTDPLVTTLGFSLGTPEPK